MRFGVEERRKEPGEAMRDPRIKGHLETHTDASQEGGRGRERRGRERSE